MSTYTDGKKTDRGSNTVKLSYHSKRLLGGNVPAAGISVLLSNSAALPTFLFRLAEERKIDKERVAAVDSRVLLQRGSAQTC